MVAAHAINSVCDATQARSSDRLHYAGRDGDYRDAAASASWRYRGLFERRGRPTRAARVPDALHTGLAASLLSPEGSTYGRDILHGAGRGLRGARCLFLSHAANPDWAFSRYRDR